MSDWTKIYNSPKYLAAREIKTITSIYILKKLERSYDAFLNNQFHILILLNVVEDVLNIRDAIVNQLNAEKRKIEFVRLGIRYIY